MHINLIRLLVAFASHSNTSQTNVRRIHAQTLTIKTTLEVARQPEHGAKNTAGSRKAVRAMQKKHTKGQRKRKRLKQSMIDKAINFRREQHKKLIRMKGLHKAAKWKRVISACHFWFSEANLKTDRFMRQALLRHHGWIPISILLTFPKFQHWTDAEIVTGALQSATASKKFEVTFCRDLCMNPETFNDIMLSNDVDWEHSSESVMRKTSNGGALDDVFDWVDEDWDEEDWEKEVDLGKDWNEDDDLNDENGWDKEDDGQKGGDVHEEEDWDEEDWDEEEDMQEKENVPEKEDGHKTMDVYGKDDVHEEVDVYGMVEGNDWDEDDDWDLFDATFSKPESVAYDDDWTNVDDELISNKSANPITTKYIGESSNMPLSAKEEIKHLKYLEVKRDHQEHLKFALVRHKKITLKILDNLDRQVVEQNVEKDEVDIAYDKSTLKKKKMPPLPKYKSERPIFVVSNPEKLDSFCAKLLSSTNAYAEKSHHPESARGIGFDVEYCTLEMDIRGNLPAMIQMASPDPKGPVGLIWIDKFPNHGQNVLKDPMCKPLREIFEDPALRKVGVKVTGDAVNLAQWFGAKSVIHIFSGLEDLEVGDRGAKLSEMSESVLGKWLPKIKELDKRKKSDRKQKGYRVSTAHWRRNDLAPIMKEYAANDASCSVDIWLERARKAEGPNQISLT